MTFAAKYEILEAVSRGAVEVFVARKVATDERVLVYIFECPEQPLNQPTVQWVLESFRALAPDPPELVAETGRYDATSYGYLVTKLPEKSALQTWIQSYEARQHGVAGAVAPPANEPPPHERVTEVADALPAHERATVVLDPGRPEEITKAFEAFRSELKPPSAAASSPSAPADAGTISAEFRGIGSEGTAAVQPAPPGDFTRQFFPGFEDEPGNTAAQSNLPPGEELREPSGLTGRPSAQDRDGRKPTDATAETPSAILRKIVFSPTDSGGSSGLDPASRSGISPQSGPSPTSPPDKVGAISTGDFTSFFRGPFDGGRPAETPNRSPAVAREKKDTGDFTRIFGPPKRESSGDVTSPSCANRNTSAASEPSSFSDLFEGPEVPKKTSSAYPSAAPSRERIETSPSGFFTAREQVPPNLVSHPPRTSADVPRPQVSSGASSEPEPPFSPRSEPEGATRVFSVAAGEPTPGLSTLPDGPSEYTRVISIGSRRPSSPGEAPAPAEPQSSTMGVALPTGMPPMPVPPPIPAPTVGYPQMPAPSPRPSPSLPQGPTASMPAKPAGPAWTMILILNGLFILAVLLVLYFVLRH